MKKLLIVLLLAFSARVFAQNTTVTATIADANGNAYAKGTASAFSLVASGASSVSVTPVPTDTTGSFVLTLPAGTYIFTVCAPPILLGVPNTSATPTQVCFSSNAIVISGVSQDIGAVMNPLAPVLGPKGSAGGGGVNPGTNNVLPKYLNGAIGQVGNSGISENAGQTQATIDESLIVNGTQPFNLGMKDDDANANNCAGMNTASAGRWARCGFGSTEQLWHDGSLVGNTLTSADRGAVNGVASLGATAKLPTAQLPVEVGIFASNFAGADLGAQINAADTSLGAGPGVINVSVSGTISTPAAIAAAGNYHTLFIGSGVTVTEAAGLATPLSCAVGSQGCIIKGGGSGATINNLSTSYNGATFTGDAITIGSKVSGWNATASTTLTADTTNAASSLTVTSTTGFVAGQDVLIKENAAGPARYAEFNVISVVTDATHLALSHPTEHLYRASTTPSVAGFTAGTLTKGFEVSNLHITSSTQVISATGSNSGVAIYTATDGIVQNINVDHIGGRGVLSGSSGYPSARIQIINNRIHDVGLVPTGTGSQGIEVYSQSSHVTIKGNQVWSTGSHGIVAHGFLHLITDNQVWWSGTAASNGACYSTDTAESIVFSNNLAAGCAGAGFLQFGSGTDQTTESTRITYANNDAQDTGGDCYSFGTAGSPGYVRTTAASNRALRCRGGNGFYITGTAGGYIAHELTNNNSEGNTTGYNFGQTSLGVQMISNRARNNTTSYNLNSASSTVFSGNTTEGATTDLALGTTDFSFFSHLAAYNTVTGTFGVSSMILGVRGITNQFSQASQTLNLANPITGVTSLSVTNLLFNNAAPTISSGFGTSPTIATNNGTASFTVNVGTGGTASSGVIALPTATNGWNCQAFDATNPTTGGGFYVKQIAGTTTAATLTGYNTAGAATAWTASDILSVSCFAR